MAATTTISTIDIEPESVTSTEVTQKEKFAKRFRPTNARLNNQSNTRKHFPSPSTTEQPLRADEIKEHRLWSLASSIICFFLIAPFIALYHSRRIRQMKNNQELTRAQLWSNRVGNILIISNIIGIIVWVAIFFLIGVLLIMGAIY